MADNEYIKRSEVVGLVEDKLKRCETVLEALAFASLRTAVMGLRSADVAPRAEWISVEERLPEKAGRYLVYGVIGGQTLVCGAHYDNYNGFGDDDITHWMPMPQPPKGGHHE